MALRTESYPEIVALLQKLQAFTQTLAQFEAPGQQIHSPITALAVRGMDQGSHDITPLLQRVKQIQPNNKELTEAVCSCEHSLTFENVHTLTALCMRLYPDNMMEQSLDSNAWKQSNLTPRALSIKHAPLSESEIEQAYSTISSFAEQIRLLKDLQIEAQTDERVLLAISDALQQIRIDLPSHIEKIQRLTPENKDLQEAALVCKKDLTVENFCHLAGVCIRLCPDNMIKYLLGLDVWEQEEAGRADEASNRVLKEFKFGCSTKLVLSNLHLGSLPEQLFYYLPELQEFFCENNALTTLPQSIASCTKLTRLECDNNLLSELPQGLGGLANLRILVCHNNQLETLPESLGECKALIHLDIRSNQLTHIPDVPLAQNAIFHNGNNWLKSLPPYLGVRYSLEQQKGQALILIREFATSHDLKIKEFPLLQRDQHLWLLIDRLILKLQNSKEYKNKTTRPIFCNRVLALLLFAEENEAYRQQVLRAELIEANSSCEDGGSSKLIHLELKKKILEISASSFKILELIKGCFIIEELDKFAAKFVEKKPKADEVEVCLGLQLLLKDRFNLPIDAQAMNYFKASKLKEPDVKDAIQFVSNALASEEKVWDYIIKHQLWNKLSESLKKEFPQEFAQAESKVRKTMESLEEASEKDEISDQVYKEIAQIVRIQFELATSFWVQKKAFPRKVEAPRRTFVQSAINKDLLGPFFAETYGVNNTHIVYGPSGIALFFSSSTAKSAMFELAKLHHIGQEIPLINHERKYRKGIKIDKAELDEFEAIFVIPPRIMEFIRFQVGSNETSSLMD